MPEPTVPPVVTLAAEHGAAGDRVATRVAEALDVPFLDRALPASLAAADDRTERASGLVGTLARASTMFGGGHVERLDLDEARLRSELAEFLKRACAEGGVVLGRGAAIVLANRPGALHVLLTGPQEGRVARVAEREGVDRNEAERRVRATDRARRDYGRRVHGVDLGDRRLYHLVVDTITLGIDASVELVIAASRVRTDRPSPNDS
jgi:cytidylate kinase